MAEHDIEKIVEAGGEVFNFRDPTKESLANKVTSVRASSSATDTNYPSEKAVAKVVESASVSDRLYANQLWGGAFRNSLSPGDVYFLVQRNSFFGPIASAITVEYSVDGGQTWIDYELTDSQKVSLFSQYGTNMIYCGKNTHIQPGYTGSIVGTKDLTNEMVPDQRVRVTISCMKNATQRWLYARIRRFGIYVITNSAHVPDSVGSKHCVISLRTSNNVSAGVDTWEVLGDYNVAGDGGWNSIPCGNDTAEGGKVFGNGSGQFQEIRMVFWSDGLSTNPAASQTGNLAVRNILASSELIWDGTGINPNMAKYGTPCTVSSDGVANFNYGIKFTARKLKTNLARTADSTFDGSADQLNIPVTGTLPVANGGTGAATAIGAEYNILNQVADIETTLDVNRKIALCNQTKSASNGVFRWIKLSNVWTLFKGLLSSESGVNISGTASGLSSTLAVGSGGTGKTSVTSGNYVVGAGTSALVEKTPKDVGSDVLSSLDDKSNASSYANFVDSDFVVGSDHVDESTISASTFVRRTALNLWNYIKSKLTGSDVNIGGNAATAGTADTAKAFDGSFTGTNSIAYALGLKQNLIAWDANADTYNASTNRAATVDSIVKRIAVKPDGFSASVDYANAVELSIPYSAGPGRVALMCVATTGNGDTVSFQATFVKDSNEKMKFVVGTIMASTGTFVSPVLKFLSSDDSSPAQKVVLYIDANVRCNLSCLVAANDGMSSITVTEVERSTADNYSPLSSWGRLANDSGVVHLDGSETIIGAKEFSRQGQATNFTDSSGAESIVRARTSSNSNNGSCQIDAYAGGGKFGVYARNASGTGKWVACLDNDGVVNLGSSGDAVRIGGTKFVFGASQLGTDSNTFYWV